MENYESFDQFSSAQTTHHQQIITDLRKLVARLSPSLDEVVKWGNGCWVNGKLPVMFVHCKDDYVQFGFYGGALLKDSDKLLRGKAEYVRHIPIKSTKDLEKLKLDSLIAQATKLDYKT